MNMVPASFPFARELFTRGTDVFGPDELDTVWGIELDTLPPIPFSEAELMKARELGQYLTLQVHQNQDGELLTMEQLHRQSGNKLGNGKLLFHTDWYGAESFYTRDTPVPGWKLTSREVLPGSLGQNYIDQTQTLSDYLVNKVYEGEELPSVYQQAVAEFTSRKAELEDLLRRDWKKCGEQVVNLRINKLFREKPVEVLYSIILQRQINREYVLEAEWTWTNLLSSVGDIVNLGVADARGVLVVDGGLDRSDSCLGVRFSRSGVPHSES